MGDRRRVRAQRERKWLRDPHCEECGVETILPEQIARIVCRPAGKLMTLPPELRDRMATIDHAHSRYSGQRLQGGKRRLLCFRCNNERGAKDEAAVPVEELRRRARQSR